MAGDGRAAAETGLHLLLDDLRADPYACETVWVAAVTFGSVADVAVMPTPLEEFQPLPLYTHGSSPLGEALELARECIAAEYVAPDFRPVAFVVTDGEPTDRWQKPAQRLAGVASVVLCGAARLTTPVPTLAPAFVRLRDATPGTFRSLVNWVPGMSQETR